MVPLHMQLEHAPTASHAARGQSEVPEQHAVDGSPQHTDAVSKQSPPQQRKRGPEQAEPSGRWASVHPPAGLQRDVRHGESRQTLGIPGTHLVPEQRSGPVQSSPSEHPIAPDGRV
jgi:hypothetical protein